MALAFPLTVRNVFDDVLQLLGFQDGNTAPLYVRERIVTDINAALQFMQAAGDEYFTRAQTSQVTVNGTPSYALAQADTQHVLGVRLADGTALRELATRGEYDLFAQICQGATAANGKPLAYYLQRFFTNAGDAGDNSGVTLFLAPTPDGVYTVYLQGPGRAPNFTYADLTTGIQTSTVDTTAYNSGFAGAGAFFLTYDAAGSVAVYFTLNGAGAAPGSGTRKLAVALVSADTPATMAAKIAARMGDDPAFADTKVSGNVVTIKTAASVALTNIADGSSATGLAFATPRQGSTPSIIPIPHRYTASIFLPIVRYNATTHPWYYHREGIPSIQADYQKALALLGLNDPSFVPAKDAAAQAKRKEPGASIPLAKPRPPVEEAA